MSEPGQRSDPAQAPDGYPPNTDPAYSGHYGDQYWAPTYYGQAYGTPGAPTAPPTEQLPPYWQPGTGYPAAAPPPPPPKSPRWLWIAAAVAVLVVAGLVLALVIVSNSARQSTVVAPPTPPNAPPSVRLTPAPIPLPTLFPQPTGEPGLPPGPGPGTANQVPETVVYSVTGEGRAINITYVDTDGVMQTEFNVALPWKKEVILAAPARNSASVAVVNVGRDVTCSVTVDGAQVRQRTGRGLTICSGIG